MVCLPAVVVSSPNVMTVDLLALAGDAVLILAESFELAVIAVACAVEPCWL